MSKRKYAVIGHPIGHTMSPFIHKRLFELSGIDADYSVMDIATKDIKNNIAELNKLDGYNITIPNKQAIIHYLDKLNRKAKLHGSVNTVKNGEFSEGFTTDADGFLEALKMANVSLGGKVVILGVGGAARTIAYELVAKGISPTVAVRPSDLIRASSLAGEIRQDVPNVEINTCIIDRLDEPIDLLINATPVGMYPKINEMPISEDLIKRCSTVFDIIYNPSETKLMKIAKENGSTVIGGLTMLVLQAVKAHEIWDGSVYAKEDILKLCEDAKIKMLEDFPI